MTQVIFKKCKLCKMKVLIEDIAELKHCICNSCLPDFIKPEAISLAHSFTNTNLPPPADMYRVWKDHVYNSIWFVDWAYTEGRLKTSSVFRKFSNAKYPVEINEIIGVTRLLDIKQTQTLLDAYAKFEKYEVLKVYDWTRIKKSL